MPIRIIFLRLAVIAGCFFTLSLQAQTSPEAADLEARLRQNLESSAEGARILIQLINL
jgi:hypothetical protein